MCSTRTLAFALTTAAASLAFSLPAKSADVIHPLLRSELIRIDIGGDSYEAPSSDLRAENRDLRRRVRRLEEAVAQLQDQVALATATLPRAPTAPAHATHKTFACSLTSDFHGTHVGTGLTAVEAKAKAMKSCEASGEHFCQSAKVTCEEAETATP